MATSTPTATPLPPEAYTRLPGSDVPMCRLLVGMWQLSGAHGFRPSAATALPEMKAHFAAGFTTFDLADHYGPAEDFVGAFRQLLSPEDAKLAQFFTNTQPRFLCMVWRLGESLRQMCALGCAAMLEFHWWDYNDRRYMDALRHLHQMRQEGKIKLLSLTNFDSDHLQQIVESGIPIATNQVQYSIVDMRPAVRMQTVCERTGVRLLTYGTLLGGLLSERWLGKADPRTSPDALSTASLSKYYRMVVAWGGWDLFQELLRTLDTVAKKHRVSIANVATRFILDQPCVAGVIVGTRLGLAEHRTDNARVFALQLDSADRAAIARVQCKANNLLDAIGDCGDEYR